VLTKFLADSAKKLLSRLLRSIAVRLSGESFGLICNLRALIKNHEIRFYYDRKRQIYLARENTLTRRFKTHKTAYDLYFNGLRYRGLALGSAYFLDAINFSKGDLVVDCGANLGDLKLYFEIKNLDVEYVGIEPAPEEFSCMAENIAPSVSYSFALWHENGVEDFYLSTFNADSSLIPPVFFESTQSVVTRRLDSLSFANIKLLKIDAEGAEPEVLLGCSQKLQQIEYISVDLGPERGVKKECTLVPVVNFLIANNYSLLRFDEKRTIALFKRN